MQSVTGRIHEITQPKGGFVNPSLFKVEKLDNCSKELAYKENLHSSVIGMAVDYLTRYMITGDKQDAFAISLMGAMSAYHSGVKDAAPMAVNLIDGLDGLTDQSIINACKLVTYDVWYRCPTRAPQAKPAVATMPDKATIENVRTMVERSLRFFDTYGPIVEDGFTFEPEGKEDDYEKWRWNGTTDFGGYTRTVSGGDGDFLTYNTLWDFKVSKTKPTAVHTLQLLMYWIMGQHSGRSVFKSIETLGIYNPRLNTTYRLDVNMIHDGIIREVESEVIRYNKPASHDNICENPFLNALMKGIMSAD